MFRANHPPKEIENGEAAGIPARIAGIVREQSKNFAKLTAADTISKLGADLEPGNVEANLAEMGKDNRYQDIKSIVASTGTVYIYSETYITEDQAESLIKNEDIKTKVAEQVREDAKNLAKVTSVSSLSASALGLEPGTLQAIVAEILKDDRYQDVRSVVASTGAVYLYSETYITSTYADILVRAEANDPCATIALTVRDESRIYPRPTHIESFMNPIFNINPEELEGHIANTLERQEFKDLRLIDASTGARYLYSSLYMDEDYARSLVEWREVGQLENP